MPCLYRYAIGFFYMHVTIIVGFTLGILSAVFFALYMVPQKIVKLDNTTFLWAMAGGVLVTALIPYAIVGFPRHGNMHYWGIGLLCGVVWCLGTLAFAAAIQRVGLALATPVKNTTGVIGTLVGLIGFQEWKTTDPWLCFSGSLLIVLAAIVIGMAGRRETPRHATVAGMLLALVAAACYASYLYPLKLAVGAIGYWEFAPWMGVGILLTATLAVLLRPGGWQDLRRCPPAHLAASALGGFCWTIALFCLIISMQMVDLSVAWSLAQLNTVPAVALGIILFHEVSVRTHWPKLVIGLLAAVVGTVLLGYAK